MFYSPATGGFYDPAIHPELPADAVRMSRARYAELIEARSAGKQIVADAKGRPVIKATRLSLEQLRDRAVNSIKGEARRRILDVASLERQANDSADIAIEAFAGAATDIGGALDRRARINAIRTASNAIEAIVARMPASNLAAFDPSSHPLWPENS
ncbi:hypothetical protein K9B35_14270 [Sphingomonas sp. R647]|uniref:hypothetical protein n=1 Tax=Sphingomonas sp. R647 TaxID=2875233 RepID=UPI001CD2ED87|nr:hypothetical protein [Sphingomonas sp. R647]MCA1199139.1 hypothetical protein [Sphingomonas sp. R647]